MSLMKWFKRMVSGAEDAADAAAPEGETAELAGLDVMATIDAHMKWKSRLESFIRGDSSEQITVEQIRPDNLCALGKWIHGDGGAHFAHLPVFAQVRDEHAQFHRCAAHTLELADTQGAGAALDELSRGDYSRASQRVKQLLAQLYIEAKNTHS